MLDFVVAAVFVALVVVPQTWLPAQTWAPRLCFPAFCLNKSAWSFHANEIMNRPLICLTREACIQSKYSLTKQLPVLDKPGHIFAVDWSAPMILGELYPSNFLKGKVKTLGGSSSPIAEATSSILLSIEDLSSSFPASSFASPSTTLVPLSPSDDASVLASSLSCCNAFLEVRILLSSIRGKAKRP